MSEEGRLFMAAVDRFLADAKAPTAVFDVSQWGQYADMGWLGVGLPEAVGGFLSTTEVALLCERLGTVLGNAPMLDNLVLCGPLLAEHGSAAQKALVAEMVQGRILLALAAFEADSRYDWNQPMASIRPGAGALSQAAMTLNGSKTRVACGQHADYFLVLAQEGSEPEALTLLLLPRKRQGVTVRAYVAYDDHPCADVRFDQVAVTAADVVGLRGEGAAMLVTPMDRAYIALAAQATGAMQKAYDLTLDYARTRTQFGKTLASNQVVQHSLVDMYVAVEEARALYQHADACLTQAKCGDGAMTHQAASRWASAAKAFVSFQGRQTGEQSVQLHGAIGMTQAYAVGGYYKRLCAISNQYGDAEWHWHRLRELDDES